MRTSLLLALALAGCAGVRPQAAFDDVRQSLDGRADARVVWRTGTAEDARADAAVDSLLAAPLTADAAVQVALLNNRRLQATYEDLGVAQAMVVQAGLLSNPAFGARLGWPLAEAGPPDLGFSVAFGLLDALQIPLRRSVARDEYAAAQARVAQAVIDLAARTRIAVVEVQAAQARQAVQRAVVANAQAGYQAALLLREAGNVPAVDLLAEQGAFEQARIDLVAAQAETAERREALARLLGVFGARADLALADALPPVPDTLAVDVAEVERQSVAASLPLAAARADAQAAARRLGLATATGLLPDLELGAEAERDDGEWHAGPEVEVVLPLFDQGQARRAAVQAEVRRRRATYYALGVETRSAARVLATRLAAAHRVARQYRAVVVPLRAQATQQTLRQYNAMQTGVFGLLQAQRQEAEAARRAVDATAAFWTARADLDALLAGRMPDLGTGRMATPAGDAMPDADH